MIMASSVLHISLNKVSNKVLISGKELGINFRIFNTLRTLSELEQFLLVGEKYELIFLEFDIFGIAESSLITKLNSRNIKTKILMTAKTIGFDSIVELLVDKVAGYISCNYDIDELTYALGCIASGEKYLSSNVGIKILENSTFAKHIQESIKSQFKISLRELDVLNFVAKGYTNEDISEKLFSSKRTIEGNRKKLLEKTGTKNTAQLVGFAIRNNIIN